MFALDKVTSGVASFMSYLRRLRASSAGILHGPREDIPEGHLPEVFEAQVSAFEEDGYRKSAVTYLDKTLTFAGLNNSANVLARLLLELLREKGGGRFDRPPLIAIFVPPSDVRIVALLAIFKIRAAYLPLEDSLPPRRIEKLLLSSGTQFLLYQTPQVQATLTEATGGIPHMRLINIEEVLGEADSSRKSANIKVEELLWAVDDNPVVCVLFTSGSTGTPKGVPIRTRSLLNRLRWQWRRFPFTETDKGCHKTSLLFVDSLTEIMGCLLQGIEVIILCKETTQNPQAFTSALINYDVSRIVLVPSHLDAIIAFLQAAGHRLESPSLKMVVSSGEALRLSTASNMFASFPDGCHLVNLYGSTETTGDVCYDVFEHAVSLEGQSANGIVSIGRPLANTSVMVLDDNMKPVGNGQIGGIYICGANIAEGYVDKDRSDSFVPNTVFTAPGYETLYKMGDNGTIINNKVYFQGRTDSQVKVRGHRVNLQEVDEILSGVAGLKQVMTLPYESKFGGVIPITFYCPETLESIEDRTLHDICVQRLPDYMIPRLCRLQSFPLQRHTGKVDRQMLLRIYDDRLHQCIPCQGEHLDTDQDILQFIASNISVPVSCLRPERSFFSNGGNSISAVSTVAEFNKRGYPLSLKDFLQASTIQDLVDTIQVGPKDDEGSGECDVSQHYEVCLLNESVNPESAITILAKGFHQKNPLDVLAGTSVESLERLVRSFWREICADDLSVVVVAKETQAIVGVTIVLDIRTHIEPVFDQLAVREINDAVEDPVKRKLVVEGGRWIDAILNAVDTSIPEQTSFAILGMMEDFVIDTARSREYDGIVTVNSHPVTMVCIGLLLREPTPNMANKIKRWCGEQ